jgi:hypothetical protein
LPRKRLDRISAIADVTRNGAKDVVQHGVEFRRRVDRDIDRQNHEVPGFVCIRSIESFRIRISARERKNSERRNRAGAFQTKPNSAPGIDLSAPPPAFYSSNHPLTSRCLGAANPEFTIPLRWIYSVI